MAGDVQSLCPEHTNKTPFSLTIPAHPANRGAIGARVPPRSVSKAAAQGPGGTAARAGAGAARSDVPPKPGQDAGHRQTPPGGRPRAPPPSHSGGGRRVPATRWLKLRSSAAPPPTPVIPVRRTPARFQQRSHNSPARTLRNCQGRRARGTSGKLSEPRGAYGDVTTKWDVGSRGRKGALGKTQGHVQKAQLVSCEAPRTGKVHTGTRQGLQRDSGLSPLFLQIPNLQNRQSIILRSKFEMI